MSVQCWSSGKLRSLPVFWYAPAMQTRGKLQAGPLCNHGLVFGRSGDGHTALQLRSSRSLHSPHRERKRLESPLEHKGVKWPIWPRWSQTHPRPAPNGSMSPAGCMSGIPGRTCSHLGGAPPLDTLLWKINVGKVVEKCMVRMVSRVHPVLS